MAVSGVGRGVELPPRNCGGVDRDSIQARQRPPSMMPREPPWPNPESWEAPSAWFNCDGVHGFNTNTLCSAMLVGHLAYGRRRSQGSSFYTPGPKSEPRKDGRQAGSSTNVARKAAFLLRARDRDGEKELTIGPQSAVTQRTRRKRPMRPTGGARRSAPTPDRVHGQTGPRS
jgi:hypothetical protein